MQQEGNEALINAYINNMDKSNKCFDTRKYIAKNKTRVSREKC